MLDRELLFRMSKDDLEGEQLRKMSQIWMRNVT